MLLSAVRSAVSSAVQSMIGTGLQPTFNLVFAGATALDQRVTFTRSTTATRVNASGVIESVAIDTPRFDYDPVTLAAKGLLIEEQRTNLVFPSEDFGAPWSIYNATRVADAGTAPDGTLTADRIDSSGAGIFRAGVGVVNATAYTYSVFLKHVSGTGIISYIGFERFGAVPLPGSSSFNLLTGTVISNGASVTASSITAFGNGWYRVSVTVTSTDVTTTLIHYAPAGDQFLMWGAQLEQGAFLTSYIPTTTAAATRAADVASVTGANFSDWYNQVEGTTYVEASTLPSVTAAALTHAISDGTFNQSIYGNFNAGNLYIGANVLNSGVNQASGIGSFSITASTNTTKDAFAYKQNNFGESCNGATPKTDSTGTVPTVDRLYIGTNWAGAGNFLNGHIRSFKYYPTRLSNGQLQSLTVLPLWTPAALGAPLALWLDANDASTITLNGSTVSQWGDKSGNGRDAVQTVAASQPSANVASLNGKNVITFSNDFLTSSVNINRSVIPNLGVFIVFKSPTGAGNYALFGNDDGAFDRFALTLFSDLPAFQWGISNGNGITPFTPTGTPDANPHILSAFLASGVTNGSYVGLDGKDFTVMTEVNYSTSETSTAIGAIDTIGTRALTGDIAEFVLVNGAVDTSIRQKIEGYLAWKWGGI